MEIRDIKTELEFNKLTQDWRTLETSFGNVIENLADEDTYSVVKVAIVGSEAIAYLTAEDKELWCIETREGFTGNGFAKMLVLDAKIEMAWEVCSDAGAAFFDALDIEFEDCRS